MFSSTASTTMSATSRNGNMMLTRPSNTTTSIICARPARRKLSGEGLFNSRTRLGPPDLRNQRYLRRLCQRGQSTHHPVLGRLQSHSAARAGPNSPATSSTSTRNILKKIAPSTVKVEVDKRGGAKPAIVERENFMVTACVDALEKGFGRKPFSFAKAARFR